MKKVFIIGIVILIILFSGYQARDISISQKIMDYIDENCKQTGSCSISMSEITDFRWDKMVIFDVGSSNSEISGALGVEYKDSVDMMSGIVFVNDKKIVYDEKFPYNPEKPNKLWFSVDNMPEALNLWSFIPDDAIFEGIKTETDGKYFYEIKPADK